MVSLSLILLLIDILVLVAIIFANVFRTRVIATSLIILDLAGIITKLFDYFVLDNKIEGLFIGLVDSLNLSGAAQDNQYVLFIAGLIVLLQLFVIWLMIYTLLRRFVPYKPPILLSKHEERTLLNEAVLWKSLLFISLNVAIIYVLVIFNYAANLPLGFLEFIFKFGFGVRA